jgi:hypothetical protein
MITITIAAIVTVLMSLIFGWNSWEQTMIMLLVAIYFKLDSMNK